MLHLLHNLRDDDPSPRYRRVQLVLRGLVESGKLAPGDKIAAEVQIADALGVSKMTVNKALLALTADGIFVREVGRGTFVASRSSSFPVQKPRIVTLSFVEGGRTVLNSDYYGGLYRGISDAFQNAPGVHLHISPVSVRDYIKEEPHHTDGRIVIAPRRESAASLDTLWQTGRHPLVVLGASWPGMTAPCVDSDNARGAQAAVAHLIDLGHTRIALLFAEPETANTQDRIRGYRAALESGGLHNRETAYEVEAFAAWKAGDMAQQRLGQLMRGSDGEKPVTAIFAAGYYLALEALNAVRNAGLRVPDDVSVAGFDDPLSAHLVFPPLTTVRQPLHAMGKRAGELILEMVSQGKNAVSDLMARPYAETLPIELIMRDSTAALHAPQGTVNEVASALLPRISK